ncbi:hypothetical protein GQ457_03G017230 [Hibiscus cannabinus]
MSEGSPVVAHVIKMMGYIQTLEKLGFALNDELPIDVVLQSLPDSFNQFVLNFNMNEINKTLPQLLGMLRTAKAKGKGKKVAKSKGIGKTKPKGKEALKPKGRISEDGKCFHCGKLGHWKRNCPVYLEDDKKAKAVGALVISFQLNEADTPSASSFQLIEAPFSSTSALLAQLKLNNPEVAQSVKDVQRTLYAYMLCIIRKGTRMKVPIASPNSMFFENELVSGGWQLRQNRRVRKFPAKRKSKLFPFVMIVDLGTNRIKEGGMM